MRPWTIREGIIADPRLHGLTLAFSSDPGASHISRLLIGNVHDNDRLALEFDKGGGLLSMREVHGDEPSWPDLTPRIDPETGQPADPHAAAEEAARQETERLQRAADEPQMQLQGQDD